VDDNTYKLLALIAEPIGKFINAIADKAPEMVDAMLAEEAATRPKNGQRK
jgi:hypothetical protein